MMEVLPIGRAREPITLVDAIAGRQADLETLPAEWVVTGPVMLPSGRTLDRVVVGPNGVFGMGVDPDPEPALLTDDGLYRHGLRVTLPVKRTLAAAHELRTVLGLRVLAYPLLVTALDAPPGGLDRLGVIPVGAIAAHIWSHPGFPLRRSQRAEILWGMRRFS